MADRMVAEAEATPAVIANLASDNENAAPQGRRSFLIRVLQSVRSVGAVVQKFSRPVIRISSYPGSFDAFG